MESDKLKNKLENMSTPKVPTLQHKEHVKLTILSTEKSSKISFVLLAIPAIILLEAVSESIFHFFLPPWGWMVKYGYLMPLWLRVTIYITVLIVIPLTVAFLNILSVMWIKYDKEQKVLNISIKLKTLNIVIISITTLIGLLFIGHTIAEWIAGAS